MSDPRPALDEPSWMAAPLRRLTTWIVARPGFTLAASLAVTLLAVLITATGLKFKMSRLDLLSPRSEYNQRWLAYLKEFGDQDDAVVVVQGEDTDDVLAAIDDLAEELKQPHLPFESVLSEWDLSAFRGKGLHFVPRDAVLQLEAQLGGLKPLFANAPSGDDPAAALKALNDRLEPIDRLPPEHVQFAEQQYGRLLEALAQAAPSAGPPPSLGNLADLSKLQEGLAQFKSHHLLMNDGQMGFVLLRLRHEAGETSRGARAIKQLREIIDDARSRHAHVQIGLTGMPILEYDEMTASQSDMVRATWLSFVCVFLFFWASFGSWRHTLFAGATLALGMAWSFGYLTLVVGHLNILSVAFAAILIGIGIDFSIHYVSHYLSYRARGVASGPALIATAAYVGPGVVTGAVTTALAFFTAAFTEFVGILELGIIAGGGILLCLVATMVSLPAMIQWVDRNNPRSETNDILHVSQWLLPAKIFPRATLCAAVVATLVIAWGLKDLRYDHNLLNLQPNHLQSVQIEREVLAGKDQSFWCALAMADNPEHARELKQQFASLDTVSRVEEVASLFPGEDADVRRAIVRLGALLSRLPPHSPGVGPPDPRAFGEELARAQAILSKSTDGRSPLIGQLAQGRRLAGLSAASHEGNSLAEALPLLRTLQAMNDPEAPRLDDLPRSIRTRFVGENGKFLLRVYAKGHIWDMDALKRFVADVESVDPHVTGHPVQTFYASRHMQKSYLQAALYSLLCVAGTLLIDFRSIKHTLLAMLPLVLGVVQMLGLMGLLNIPFNPANMIALPLILGMGVENGVHLVHEYRRQRGRFQLGNATAMAVMLTSTTTIAGFACMIVARHQGLRSLGQILTFGMTTCMLVSLYALPALLRWISRNRPEIVDETVEASSRETDGADSRAESSEEQTHSPRPRVRPTRARANSIDLLSDDRAA